MNSLKVKTFILSLLYFLFIPTPVLAGGGLVSFDVSPSGEIPLGFQSTIRATVYNNDYSSMCKQCPIVFKVASGRGGNITQSDSKTDDNGNATAKFTSQEVGEKVVYAEVTLPDGSIYTSSQYILYYFDATPKGSISLQITSQKDLGGNLRKVALSWNSIPDALDYFVFVRPATTPAYGVNVVDTRSLNGEVTINNSADYFVKVNACTGFGMCVESSEVHITSIKQENSPAPIKKPTIVVTTPKIIPTSTVKPIPTSTPIVTSIPTSKIESLPNKLDQPKIERSFLQERVSSIFTWLKSILPFFK